MSDFRSFVRAIIHAPSDRTVQLVFADWLDQYTGEAEWARRLRVGPADPELPDRPREMDWRWEETVTLDVPTPGAVRSDFLGSLVGLTLNSLRRQGRISRDEERVTKDRLPAKLALDGKPVYDRLVAIPPGLISKSAWAGLGVEVRSGESHVAWRKGPHRTYALYSAAETVDPVLAADGSSSTDAPTSPTEL